MQLGLVTYNIARDWTLEKLLETAERLGYEGVELRTTHAHGVEPSLSPVERVAVRHRFAASRVALVGLGTTCEFHAADPAVVARNEETARAFIQLAADVGARGVKVRPNGFVSGIPKERTLAQIGESLRRLGEFASAHGVEIWLEMHGNGTCEAEPMQQVMQACAHPAVGLCWNSNPTDVRDGHIDAAFTRVAPWIRHVHINELTSPYPWRELFAALKAVGYTGFCMAEIAASSDAKRLLHYYRALWLAWQP